MDAFCAKIMNFSWVDIDLAACRGPQTAADLGLLRNAGIVAIVRLASEEETGLSSQLLHEASIADCFEPIEDFGAPDQSMIDRVVEFIERMRDNQRPVAVSCYAGQGRTGTIIACYFVACRLSADAAIEEAIRRHPPAKEILDNPNQLAAIHEYYTRTSLRDGAA